jgi:hypothetical protein
MFGIDDAIAAGLKILDKFIPDPAERAKAASEFQGSMERLRVAQINLNAEEVKSGHWLGKWRGALGWGLTASAIYQFMAHPFLVAILLALDHTFPVERLPKLDWKQLGSLLLGMLGLA